MAIQTLMEGFRVGLALAVEWLLDEFECQQLDASAQGHATLA
ncbi:hypothetical protein ACLBXM_09155 [Xanthobacteraceae bacterium A53D]